MELERKHPLLYIKGSKLQGKLYTSYQKLPPWRAVVLFGLDQPLPWARRNIIFDAALRVSGEEEE